MISLLLAMTIAHAAPTNAELKIGTTSEFDTLHPLVTNMSGSNYIISAALRTMVVFDINAKLIPSIAKKIPTLADKDAQTITENGVKKVAATFEILENAKWGDGVPVTCKDFALAVDVGHSKNVAISETEQFNHVERVEFDQKSPKKCRFIYTGSEFNFAETPKVKPLPEHLEGPIFQKYKNTPMAYEQNSLYVKEPTNPGLWNGPYKLTEVKVGSHVRLEPNPYFYGQKPQIKKIFIKLIPNSGTIEANLRSGTIDMVMVYVVNIDQALSMERLFKKDNLPYVFNYKDGFNYEHLDVNLDHPVLSSLVVRKALMHGIDREQISKSMFEGRQPVAHYSTPSSDVYFTNDPKYVIKYNYDPKKAIELLEKEGWKLGTDGIRIKDGKRLSFYLMTTAGNKTRENVQSYLMEKWKQIGAEVIIKNEPPRVLFGDTLQKRKYQGLVLYTTGSAPGENPAVYLHGRNIPTAKNSYSGQNYTGYDKASANKILDAFKTEFNLEKRKQLMKEFAKEVSNDLPTLPLFYRADISITPANLKNYQLTGHIYVDTNNVEKWTLE